MRILHIDSGENWRGGQRQCLILHKGLIKNGCDSKLICSTKGELYNQCKQILPESLYPMDLRKNFFLSQLFVNKVIKEFRPEIVHFHDSRSALFTFFSRRKIKTIHTRRVAYPIKYLSRFLKYKKIDCHVGVSDEITQYLSRFFKNCTTINSCVEIERFKIKPNDVLLKNGKLNILFVGAFSSQKGIEILINEFERTLPQKNNFVLHLVGDGELKDKIRSMIETKQLASNVCFYGARLDVENFYLLSDIVISPSINGEGSNGVIKEAMCARKLIIASNLKANLEIIEDNQDEGIFNPRKIGDLSKKILSFSTNRKLDALKIEKKSEQFSCEVLIRSYLDLYTTEINRS